MRNQSHQDQTDHTETNDPDPRRHIRGLRTGRHRLDEGVASLRVLNATHVRRIQGLLAGVDARCLLDVVAIVGRIVVLKHSEEVVEEHSTEHNVAACSRILIHVSHRDVAAFVASCNGCILRESRERDPQEALGTVRLVLELQQEGVVLEGCVVLTLVGKLADSILRVVARDRIVRDVIEQRLHVEEHVWRETNTFETSGECHRVRSSERFVVLCCITCVLCVVLNSSEPEVAQVVRVVEVGGGIDVGHAHVGLVVGRSDGDVADSEHTTRAIFCLEGEWGELDRIGGLVGVWVDVTVPELGFWTHSQDTVRRVLVVHVVVDVDVLSRVQTDQLAVLNAQGRNAKPTRVLVTRGQEAADCRVVESTNAAHVIRLSV